MKKISSVLKKKWVVIAGVLLILPFLLEVTGIFATGTWRYKMTVVVETPEGIKEGSVVRQLSNSAVAIKILDLPEAGNPPSFKGEAVVVDLGERGLLFAILAIDPYYEFYEAFRERQSGASTVEGIRDFNRVSIGTKKIISPETFQYYPIFVTFKDINDPKSVERVFAIDRTGLRYQEPNKIIDNTEEILGKGFKIKEVFIERTREPVTWGLVDQYLPKTYNEVIVKGWHALSNKDQNRLSHLTRFKMERN